MAIFSFDNSYHLGKVRAVDTRTVVVQVNSDEDLRKARVGQLVALSLPGAVEEWLVGMIDKVIKQSTTEPIESLSETALAEEQEVLLQRESVVNSVKLTLLGAVSRKADNAVHFSRSLIQVPEIDGMCYIMRDAQLQSFMNLLSKQAANVDSLQIGLYTIDENATAYLDGNKLFQRHATLLGSTGSGKSWAVASIMEQAAKLPSSNIIVFDLHGEYGKMSYAKHFRIPGPEELRETDDSLLYLPYWLLNAEEMQALFIDKSESSAHNQVIAFQETVISEKRATLTALEKTEVLNAFTLDSPIPFSLENVLTEIKRLNEEMVQGQRGEKQGPFHGSFSRLLVRLNSKITDKRYGFLFQAPDSEHKYESMVQMVKRILDYSKKGTQIKVIDFSEVPSDILPVIVGLVARIIYQIQFWTDREKRHPLAFICDEAHLYLPKKDGKSNVEQRAIENFEKIAKEGRKYGVALFIISQRPSDVSTTILSQCNNLIALRLSNNDDQSVVRRLMPESLEGLMDSLPILDVGEALVVGDSVLLPSRIRLFPPSEKPLSATIEFWDVWSEKKNSPDFEKSVENLRRQNRL